MISTLQQFKSLQPVKHSTLDPQDSLFREQPLHLFILTRNGRPIYTRFGNLVKSATFTATLATIVNKWAVFDPDKKDSLIFKISVKKLKYQIIFRGQIMFVLSSRLALHQDLLRTLVDAVYIQLTSILTDRFQARLLQNPNYDPSVQIGSAINLIDYTIQQGIHSPVYMLQGYPMLRLNESIRGLVLSAFKESRDPSVIVCVLMTMTDIIQIFHSKQVTLRPNDVLLLFNMFHVNRSLLNGENWFPLCLPGISAEGNLQCYTSVIHTQKLQLLFVALTDSQDTEMFYHIRSFQKSVASKLTTPSLKIISNLNLNIQKSPKQISMGTEGQRHQETVTILALHKKLGQLTGNCDLFGQSVRLQQLSSGWSKLLSIVRSERQRQCFEQGMGVIQSEQLLVLFACSGLTSLFEMRSLGKEVVNLIKKQSPDLFMLKFI